MYNGEATEDGSFAWDTRLHSPHQLELVKMESHSGDSERRVRVATEGYSLKKPILGTDPKMRRTFEVEPAGHGIFRLRPDRDLDRGEYCFVLASPSAVSGAEEDIVLFDFSVE